MHEQPSFARGEDRDRDREREREREWEGAVCVWFRSHVAIEGGRERERGKEGREKDNVTKGPLRRQCTIGKQKKQKKQQQQQGKRPPLTPEVGMDGERGRERERVREREDFKGDTVNTDGNERTSERKGKNRHHFRGRQKLFCFLVLALVFCFLLCLGRRWAWEEVIML